MAYVTVPKDLTKVKSKVALNLTKRQLVCFGAAAVVGVPLFFLIKDSVPQSAATFIMVLVMLPFFMLAMYEKHGQPLETILGNIIKVFFLTPKERPYQTANYYAVLEKLIIITLESHCVHTWEPLKSIVLSRLGATTIYSG